jgi:hypothetical protein
MDSTRVRAAVTVAAVLALAVLLLRVAVARADGDPASDILAADPAFVPPDGGTAAQLLALDAELGAARVAGYPLRVAVIGSAADLGSIAPLWRRPQQYAEFLAVELAQAAPAPVLVVMPDGFGLAQQGVSPASDVAQLARTPAPARRGDLAAVALAAVRNLSGAAGHRLVATRTPGIVFPSAGGDAGIEAFVLGLGGALIAAAWTLSLRARPLRRREQRP